MDIEDQSQLHLRPVVQGIARQAREDLGVLGVLFGEIRISRYEALVHTAHPHGAPLVVVATQPQLAQVGEASVGLDLFFVEMAMVINDGQILDLRVECLGRLRAKQNVRTEKFFHNTINSFCF